MSLNLHYNILSELEELKKWYYREDLENFTSFNLCANIFRERSSEYLKSRNIDFSYFEKSFVACHTYIDSLEFSPDPITFVNERNVTEFIFLTFYLSYSGRYLKFDEIIFS